jgi:hypothetical protein
MYVIWLYSRPATEITNGVGRVIFQYAHVMFPCRWMALTLPSDISEGGVRENAGSFFRSL